MAHVTSPSEVTEPVLTGRVADQIIPTQYPEMPHATPTSQRSWGSGPEDVQGTAARVGTKPTKPQ
jgi:hypothetical protein